MVRTTKRGAAALLGLMVGASCAGAAEMYSDVPRGHWAYDAIQRAVDAGVLEGVDGKFMGQKLITRHQMAVVVAKLLDRMERNPGSVASKMQPRDIANLEALTIEFADELALMNVKVSTLEDAFVELKNTVEALKAGHHLEEPHGSSGTHFSGLLAFGLIATDDQTGSTPSLTRYAGTPDQTFFAVPQASLALDLDIGQGVGMHTQFDYASDAASAPPAAGTGVQLNEAYLTWDNGPGPLGLKMGIFALPFQSWEVNGPMRTSMNSISPSGINRLWETQRPVGVELQRSVNQTADSMKWRLGLFTGNDRVAVLGGGPGAGRAFSPALLTHSDAPISGSGTGTMDGSPGFYLDLESGTTGRFGWRLGYFAGGGDNTANAPNTASNDLNAFQLGGWLRGDTWRATIQALFGSEDYGAGAANTDDLTSFLFSFKWDWSADRSVFIRYEDWEVDNTAAGTGSFPGGDRTGNTVTLAFNQAVTDTSQFQFEYLAPSEDTAAGSSDVNDDLIQARYKVWW